MIAGLLMLVVALPSAIPIRRSPESMGLSPDGESGEKDRTAGTGPAQEYPLDIQFTVKDALKTLHYWVLMAGISLRLFVTVALNAHFIPVLVWKGMNEGTGAYLLSLFALSSVLAMLIMGWMGDRWSKSRLSGAGVLPLVIILLGLAYSEFTSFSFFLPIGLGVAMGTAPLNWALIGDAFGRRSYATLRGIMGIGYGMACFVSPIYAGWVFDFTGGYTIVLVTFSLVLLVTAWLFIRLRHPAGARSISTHED